MRSQPVTPDDPATRALVDDLFDTVADARGIGLAANQIGVASRVYVVDLSRVVVGGPQLALINPEMEASGGPLRGEEGCLSFPGLYLQIERPEQARLRYQELDGSTKEIEASGLMARVLLHELDHLNGVLFIDHQSSARRVLIAAKLKQMARRQKRGETA
jgi:peptide deformylase